MSPRRSAICVICGVQPATTRDHVPPKCIFPQPRPHDLLQVDACSGCNNGSSKLDESFKVFVGMAAGHGIEGEKRFRGQTLATVEHNKKLKREIILTAKNVELITEAGLFIGQRLAVRMNSASHDRVIERIIRGLHFEHTGHILGDKADIKIQYYGQQYPKKVYQKVQSWPKGSIGGDQFIYHYAACEEEPLGSAWVFQLFNSVWSGGIVLPK